MLHKTLKRRDVAKHKHRMSVYSVEKPGVNRSLRNEEDSVREFFTFLRTAKQGRGLSMIFSPQTLFFFFLRTWARFCDNVFAFPRLQVACRSSVERESREDGRIVEKRSLEIIAGVERWVHITQTEV